jgi:hypothetical protein
MALRLVERFDELAEAAEQFADSILNWEEMKQIRKVIPALRRELDDEFGPNEVQYATLDALECATREKPYDALGASHEARHSFAAQLIQGPNRDVSGSDWDAAHS